MLKNSSNYKLNFYIWNIYFKKQISAYKIQVFITIGNLPKKFCDTTKINKWYIKLNKQRFKKIFTE